MIMPRGVAESVDVARGIIILTASGENRRAIFKCDDYSLLKRRRRVGSAVLRSYII